MKKIKTGLKETSESGYNDNVAHVLLSGVAEVMSRAVVRGC